jgi:hypothetical protein
MIPAFIPAFFGTLVGKLAFLGAVVAAFLGWRIYDVSNQRSIGADRAVIKIEKATENATKLGTAAAAKSVSSGVHGGVRGRRDPSTRDD